MSRLDSKLIDELQLKRINNIMRAAEHLEEVIKQNCPKNYEREVALRTLEEVAMWANKAIEFEGADK